jgi:microcystin-dependent protein
LQDIANLATFRTGTNQTADDSTIQVDGSGGYLKVKSLGITSNELATDSVITAKIQNGAVTSDKLDATAISVLMPSGTILPYSGASAPGATSPIADYLICDGRSLNTYDYRDLHAVISNTYGGTAYNPGTTDQAGASTVFNIPDIRGRVIAGLDVLQGTRSNRLTATSAANINAQTLGANNGNPGDVGRGTNGAQEHDLTHLESGLPAHAHSTQLRDSGPAGGGYLSGYQASNGSGALFSTDSVAGANAASAHNNVQPTIILNYIIKT